MYCKHQQGCKSSFDSAGPGTSGCMHGCEHLLTLGMQEKFDERWQVLLIPKLAEEELHMRNDAVTVRKQRLDNAQVCCITVLPLNCCQALFLDAGRANKVALPYFALPVEQGVVWRSALSCYSCSNYYLYSLLAHPSAYCTELIQCNFCLRG